MTLGEVHRSYGVMGNGEREGEIGFNEYTNRGVEIVQCKCCVTRPHKNPKKRVEQCAPNLPYCRGRKTCGPGWTLGKKELFEFHIIQPAIS